MRNLVVIILLSAFTSFAHSYRVEGTVVDVYSGLPIEQAVVSYRYEHKIYSTYTDSLGHYEFMYPRKSGFVLKVSHLNYKSESRMIRYSGKSGVNANFELIEKIDTLGEVVVTAKSPILFQRNDTTVYDVRNIKVNSDATLIDVVQKLPGIGMRDGKVESQGETVKEVLIDGQEFFRGDITTSLKNLPADIIKEIQLFDKMSDYSLMTGFDDGSRKKVINIITKNGVSQDMFGKVYGGYGLDDYYKVYGMFNWFRGNRQLSLFAQSNDISEQNFSMIDLLSTTGTSMNTAPQQSPYSKANGDNTFHPVSNDVSDLMVGGYSAGETTTNAIGANFSDIWGNLGNLSIVGHYMYNNAINETNYDIRDDYYSDNANTNLQTQYVRTENINNRFNTKITWSLSESDNIMFRPSVLYQHQKEFSNIHISEKEKDTSNEVQLLDQNQNTDQEAFWTSNELMYIHKFKARGSSLSVNVKYSFENTDENLNLSLENLQVDSENMQTTWSQNKTQGFAAVGSYIQRLGLNIRTKIDCGWSSAYRSIKRHTQRGNNLEQCLKTDSVLSGKTTSDYGGLLCGLSLLYNRKKDTQVVAGLEYHSYRMNAKNDITNSFNEIPAILPFLQVRHQWGKKKNQLHIQYKTDQIFPTSQQLQDAINNVNPTVAVRGNVYLKPSYSHSASLRLVIPMQRSGGIFVFFANAELIDNYIANKRSIAGGALGAAEARSQLLSYENTSGFKSGSALLAYGFPFSLIKSNVNISTLLRYSHIPGYWESEKSYNNQMNWNNSLTIGSNISSAVDFVCDFNLQYQKDKNVSHPLLDINYWTISFGGQINWQFLPHFKAIVECGRTIYKGLETNEMNATILNLALGYKFMKDNVAELRLSCDDVLDKNNYFSQQTNELYRRKTIANVLGRHTMLTFTYNFKTAK